MSLVKNVYSGPDKAIEHAHETKKTSCVFVKGFGQIHLFLASLARKYRCI